MARGIDQQDFSTIDAAANRWPDPWPDRFRERAAILWTEANQHFVALTAWRGAFEFTIEEAKAQGVTLEDPFTDGRPVTFEESSIVVRWNTRPQDVPAFITGLMRMR